MSWHPKFKIIDPGTGNLLYTFLLVQSTNAPRTERKTVEHEGQRAEGSIVLDGGKSAWDLEINGIFLSEESRGTEAYADLITMMDAMETALEVNTSLILRIDKTSVSYYQYNIKRLRSIEYPPSLRINAQNYQCVLRANSW